MARRYARRFPRITPPTPASAQQTSAQAKQNYDKSLWRDLWELFKRVAALEAGSGGPGGAVVSLTAVSPIVASPPTITGTGSFSHANSGVSASTYGDASNVPQITVDVKGHVTAVTNVAIVGGGGGGGTLNIDNYFC